MSYLSGQPMYCYTLAMELAREHQVTLVSCFSGEISDIGRGIMRENLMKCGVVCFDFSEYNGGDYDIAFLSERISEQVIPKIFCRKIVNIVHSEYACETPISQSKIYRYVAVRPAIKDHLISEHAIVPDKINIIYNGVDRNRFDPKKRKSRDRTHRQIVIPCLMDKIRRKFLNYAISQASKHLRINIYGIHRNARIGTWKKYLPRFLYKMFPLRWGMGKYVQIFDPVWNIEDVLASADEVWGILLGRVNLEANSMVIPSRIFDPVTLKNELFLLNDAEFDKRHNIKNVAQKLLNL